MRGFGVVGVDLTPLLLASPSPKGEGEHKSGRWSSIS
jgi:hypothetical protein